MATKRAERLVIPSGQSKAAAALDLGRNELVAIQMPAAFTGTSLTFQGAVTDAADVANIYDAGAELTVTVAVSQYVILDPAKFAGIRFINIRSGTAASPTNQAADRTLILVVREV